MGLITSDCGAIIPLQGPAAATAVPAGLAALPDLVAAHCPPGSTVSWHAEEVGCVSTLA